MKCVTVVGTRPEFIQTSRVSRALRVAHSEILVNTGQHYDDAMSGVFFRELGIPLPDIDLQVGVEGASHAQQTAAIMLKLEPLLVSERPDWVLVYGDTNSTLAAALVGAKLRQRIAHVEAGLRSFDRGMPEEINRILTDHLSELFLCPTATAVRNLEAEGIRRGVVSTGDVRVNVLAEYEPRARPRLPELLARCGLSEASPFALATIHRDSNTDVSGRLEAIVAAFGAVDQPVVLPVHPRLQKRLDQFGLKLGPNVRVLPPLGFLDLLALLAGSSIVFTDSGGLQKEAYMLGKRCVTLRDSTEWTETVEVGWNTLAAPADLARLASAARLDSPPHPDLYGTPGVSERIVQALEAGLG